MDELKLVWCRLARWSQWCRDVRIPDKLVKWQDLFPPPGYAGVGYFPVNSRFHLSSIGWSLGSTEENSKPWVTFETFYNASIQRVASNHVTQNSHWSSSCTSADSNYFMHLTTPRNHTGSLLVPHAWEYSPKIALQGAYITCSPALIHVYSRVLAWIAFYQLSYGYFQLHGISFPPKYFPVIG